MSEVGRGKQPEVVNLLAKPQDEEESDHEEVKIVKNKEGDVKI